MGIRERIKEKIKEYEALLARYEGLIVNAKPPLLRLYLTKAGRSYSKVTVLSRKTNKRRTSKITDTEAFQIQRDHFCLRMVKILRKNLRILQHCLKHIKEPDPALVMAEMAPAYRMTEQTRLAAQGTSEQPGSPGSKPKPKPQPNATAEKGRNTKASGKDQPAILTADGTLVASRIEALIYNALLVSGLKFAYELPLTLDGIIYRPDFTIWLPDGRKIYREHLGLLVDDNYSGKQWRKIKAYYNNNIVVGSNLILTADYPDLSIDTQMIDEIIRGLKRMAGMAA